MNILNKIFGYNPFKWHIVTYRGGFLIRKFCFHRMWWGYHGGAGTEDWCFLSRKVWLNLEYAQAALAGIKQLKEDDKQVFVEQ